MNTPEIALKEANTRPSMRKAINDKCKDCIWDPLSGLGNWRQQVQGCTSVDCPLYPLRPLSKPRGAEKREEEVSLETEHPSP